MKLLAFLLLFAGIATAQTHSVTLTWSPNTTGDPVATYNVLRGPAAGAESSTPIGSVLASACTATCTYVDSAVVGGTTYYYEVTATNSGGTSGPSKEVSATVPYFPPAIPATPTVTVR
jgi:hypothetical protein